MSSQEGEVVHPIEGSERVSITHVLTPRRASASNTCSSGDDECEELEGEKISECSVALLDGVMSDEDILAAMNKELEEATEGGPANAKQAQGTEQGDNRSVTVESTVSATSSSSTQKVSHLSELEPTQQQPANVDVAQNAIQHHPSQSPSANEQVISPSAVTLRHVVAQSSQSSVGQASNSNQESEQNSPDTHQVPPQSQQGAHALGSSEQAPQQQQQQQEPQQQLPKVPRQRQKSQQKGRFFVQPQSFSDEEENEQHQALQQKYQQQEQLSEQFGVAEQPQAPPQQHFHHRSQRTEQSGAAEPQQAQQQYHQQQPLQGQPPQSHSIPQQHQFQPPIPQQQHAQMHAVSPQHPGRQQSLPQQNSQPQFAQPQVVHQALQEPTAASPAIIGMVGNTPIVSLPDTNGQIVMKKKGRFKFLEQAPGRAASSGRMGEETDTVEYQRHERSYSVPAVASCSITPPSQPGKTFEGTGAPVVKKKGRFVVTSVPVQAPVSTSQPMLPVEATLVQPPPPVQTGIVHQSYDGPASTMTIVPPGQVFPAAAPPPDGTAGVPSGLPPSAVVPPPPPPTSHGISPVPTMATPIVSSESGTPSSYLQQQPLPTSEEPGPSNSANTATQLNQQPRAPTSRPTTIARQNTSGLAGQQGFGKMFYFLDQMKLEVTDADRKIKSLQTDMKCLKEKNKELEAKAREMERKWNQEKALREVAETRLKALKKKIRAMKDDNQIGELDTAREDEYVGSTHQTGGTHSRANSLDGTLDLTETVGVGSSNSLLVAKHAAAPHIPYHDLSGTMYTIDQTVNQIASSGNESNLRPPTDLSNSPLRDAGTMPLPGQHQGQQSSTAPIGPKIGEHGDSITEARSNAKVVGGTRGVSNSHAQNKPNHLRQQQQPPTNQSSIHASDLAKSTAHGDHVGYAAQPSSASNLGAPPRPLVNKTRTESTSSLGSSRSNTSDFDPLRPMLQEPQSDDAGPVTESEQTPHRHTSSVPVYMTNRQQAAPLPGAASQAVEGSDLMTFQSPTMQVEGSDLMGFQLQVNRSQTDASMSMPHGQRQSAMGHQRTHSGKVIVPLQAMMPMYQDQPPMTANSMQDMQQQPQTMMTMQQSVAQLQSQQQLQWAPQQHYSYATTAQAELQSSQQQPQTVLQTTSDLLPSQPSKFELASDPFDELVQQRRPSQLP